MAAKKKSSTKDSSSSAKADAPADAGVVTDPDKALEVGYFGFSPDENPNEAYSLETGPDGPPVNPEPPSGEDD